MWKVKVGATCKWGGGGGKGMKGLGKGKIGE